MRRKSTFMMSQPLNNTYQTNRNKTLFIMHKNRLKPLPY